MCSQDWDPLRKLSWKHEGYKLAQKLPFFLLKLGKESMSVDSLNHFYVEALYNFHTSQKVVSTREFLWAIIKGLMVNWWAELMVSIKADWTSDFRQINKVTNVEVQISSLTLSFLSLTRQAPVVIKRMLSFLYQSSVHGPALVKTGVSPDRHRRRAIINLSKQTNEQQPEKQLLEILEGPRVCPQTTPSFNNLPYKKTPRNYINS